MTDYKRVMAEREQIALEHKDLVDKLEHLQKIKEIEVLKKQIAAIENEANKS